MSASIEMEPSKSSRKSMKWGSASASGSLSPGPEFLCILGVLQILGRILFQRIHRIRSIGFWRLARICRSQGGEALLDLLATKKTRDLGLERYTSG